MRFALIGQPNCGKSTLFNQVAGYRAETGNFSGTTTTFTASKVRVLGQLVELVDLPGTYTLAGTNPAERVVIQYLEAQPVDVIINILDASHLAQGLSLTLELMELGIPMIVAANMMDEIARMGIGLDGELLQDKLGVHVLPLVASKSRGVRNLFVTAMNVAQAGKAPLRQSFTLEIETAIHELADVLLGHTTLLGPDAVAIKLLEGETSLINRVQTEVPAITDVLVRAQRQIRKVHGQSAIWVLNLQRHQAANQLSAEVICQHERRLTKRDRLDDILLHPFWGYVALVAILWVFFQGVYGFGSMIEAPLLDAFNILAAQVDIWLGERSLLTEILVGVVQGIAGGVAIVLPYLLPFLIGLSFLEDIGYLPRLAFLMDALMTRIGLHGKAIVPFILGYGCNVPAVMSTRMLENRRDQFLAAMMATLVPCAARLAVVFGLVAFYLGPSLALVIYLFNLFVIALTGRILSRLMPEESAGMILEMPVYRLPALKNLLHKTWFRAREFIFEAWPLLIIGSVVLALLQYFAVSYWFNALARPVTWLLGLPAEVGVPLIFGILRKELSLVMLQQALGVTDFSQALTPVQMITFTVFVVFYVPCLATLAAIRRELGQRDMFLIAGLTVVIAMVAALVARGISTIVY
jgi:ferrous iron transport protein B